MVGDTPKLDAVIDGNLPDDLDSASIFSKVIGHKLSDSSSSDIYLLCRIKSAADTVQTQTPQFIDMGLSTINTLNESSGLRNPLIRIRRPTDGSDWSMPDHVFGEVIVVGISEAKSDHEYHYKTEFQIWKENK